MPEDAARGLDDALVLCVGGASGMGYGVAEAALEAGAQVVVTSRSNERAARAAAQLGPRVRGVGVDISDEASVSSLFDGLDSVDHLMITAGAVGRSSFLDAPPSEADEFMKTKLWGTHRVIWHARDSLSARASIGLITGGYAQWATPEAAHVHTAFAATEALARTVAVSLAPMRCNVIRPGFVDTALWDFMPDDEREALREKERSGTLTGRVVTPRDIGNVAVALMLAESVTGVVVPVDGGRHLSRS